MRYSIIKSIAISFLLLFVLGCAYYNILFNAEKSYDAGMKKIELSKDHQITPEIRKDFYTVIDKCWKLINIYSDSSKYADDALLLIGKSHFNVEEYVKSERFLRQFTIRYKNSEFIADAYLWLGKSLMELERDDEALEQFNKVLATEENNDLYAHAYINMGQVFFNKKAYDLARTQYAQVSELSDDEELQAFAQFLIANTYYDAGEYSKAVEIFKAVQEYDASVDLLFDAIMKGVESFIELEDYDQAISILELANSETKFLDKRSIIRAKIGDCYKIQEMISEATAAYADVLETYPRSEGSAIAAFGLAQLMEFAYSDLDSAKGLYQRVGREYRETELKEESDQRAKILEQYQKIRASLNLDLDDLRKLEITKINQDSLLADSVLSMTVNEDTVNSDEKKATQAKKGAKRSKEAIKKSLENNRFALAEFFLLTLANYDSAVVSYNEFIHSSTDSLLIPKAHYALYYLYKHELDLSATADSIKQIILSKYTDTPYAVYFSAQDQDSTVKENEISPYKYMYLQGEALLYDDKFYEAIQIFNQIAEEDSGSTIAQKSRFVIAWIYENKLQDIESAIEAYTLVASEYPNSKESKIAHNKIKEPVEEEPPEQSTEADSLMLETEVPADTIPQFPMDEELIPPPPEDENPDFQKEDREDQN